MRHPIHFFGYSALGLFGVYLVLVGATLFFASAQTHLSRTLHEVEGSLTELEQEYYVAIQDVHEIDPRTMGLETPLLVTYVTAGRSNLSRAGE